MTPGRPKDSEGIRFGEWLRTKRMGTGLSIESSAKLSGVSVRRLKGLEMGLSGRVMTAPEAKRLSIAYGVDLTELVDRATAAVKG